MNESAITNRPEYTVSELSIALKKTVESTYGHVRVRGEISGLKRAASGHVYLALKDEKSVLDGVCWRGVAGKLRFQPEDGLEVIVTGRLTTYAGRSKYQIVIEEMEPAGEGALMALLEARKKQLAAEGLFAAEKKQALPYLPEVIGVVTSPTGAVIRDILHRLADRFPRRVLVWPVLVQGEGAAEQIASAIRGFNQLDEAAALPRPDLLIVARGGGSLEDLWAFNEECVARAVAESQIPLISAVGHETDTTLIDYASDRRAPTPTAAAEMAVPVRSELISDIRDRARRLDLSLQRRLKERGDNVRNIARGLPAPGRLFDLPRQSLDDMADRLPRALRSGLATPRGVMLDIAARLSLPLLRSQMAGLMGQAQDLSRRLHKAGSDRMLNSQRSLSALARILASLSYENALERGYAVIRDEARHIVASKKGVHAGDSIDIQFRDGHEKAVIGKPTIAAKTRKPRKPSLDGSQGDLF